MAEPTIIDLKRARVKFIDGTATPNELEIEVGEGNLTYTRARNVEYRLNRGKLNRAIEGDEIPMAVTINAEFTKIRSSSGENVSITEFLEKEGAASQYETTGTNECDLYAIDIVIEIDQNCGTVEDEVIYLREFRFEEIGGDFDAGQLSISGNCNRVKPEAVRTAYDTFTFAGA